MSGTPPPNLEALWRAALGRTVLAGNRRVRLRGLQIGDRVIYKVAGARKGEPKFWLGTVVPSVADAEAYLYPAPSRQWATEAEAKKLAESGALFGRDAGTVPTIRWDHNPDHPAAYLGGIGIRLKRVPGFPAKFKHESFWLTVTVEENGSSSGSGCATTIRFRQPWAGTNGGIDDEGQTFTIQGNSEHHEFFQLMQRIGRALGYLPDTEGRKA